MNRFLWICIVSLNTLPVQAQELNGFNLKGALIPVSEILRGGPPRDGIPSIDQPVFEKASKYKEFSNSSQVLGVVYNGVAKAYPVRILDWHEIVNDQFGSKPVAITYCPLCGSGIAFEADVVNGKRTEFGVSGLLYNSDVLLYDRTTNSLWSQILGKAINGRLKGQELEAIVTQRTSLGAWKKLHPETLVLTTNTGFIRDYQQSPYGSYDLDNRTIFPVANSDNTFHKKEWVIGFENNGVYKAYSIKRLANLPEQKLVDKVGGEVFSLTWDKQGENLRIKNVAGKEMVGLQMFWFAWSAFHPETEIFK